MREGFFDFIAATVIGNAGFLVVVLGLAYLTVKRAPLVTRLALASAMVSFILKLVGAYMEWTAVERDEVVQTSVAIWLGVASICFEVASWILVVRVFAELASERRKR